MVHVLCPQCHSLLSIPEELAGKKCRCPHCQGVCAAPPTGADPVPVSVPANRTVEEGRIARPPHACPPDRSASQQGDAVSPDTQTFTDPDILRTVPISLAGIQVPGYEILEELGRGGMGVVYKARQQALKRLVALKMILAGDFAEAKDLARFRAEAETLARLHHPHIVQIYEVGEHNGQPYFSLEYLDGGNLSRRLAGTPLPPSEAAPFLEKLALAVHVAHQHGIVHRDLKPGNILLQIASSGLQMNRIQDSAPDKPDHSAISDLQSVIPKIADFGLAKQLDLDSGQTRSGAIMGTPSYMAPEQARGESKLVGPAADIYALGAILYQMLTGRPPFKGLTPVDTLMQVTADEPVPPSQLQPKVPRDLETICLKCLRKEIGKRYASADELAQELRRYLDGRPIQARPVGWRERTTKWARRHPAAAALIGVTCLAVLILLGVEAYFTQALTRERNAAVGERIEADRQGNLARKGQAAAQEQRQRAEDEKARAEKAQVHAQEQRQRAEDEKITADKERRAAELARGEEAVQRARAEDGEKEARAQLDHARQSLFSAQVARAAGLWRTDPDLGLQLLGDLRACPPQMRDFAWYYYARLCQREQAVYSTGLHDALLSLRGSTLVAFSPDGKLLADACGDSLRLWNFTSGKLLQQVAGVTGVVFSRDGKQLILAGADKTIKLWDIAGGKESRTYPMPGMIGSLALNAEGNQIAVAIGQFELTGKPRADGEVILVHLETGEKKTFVKGNPIGARVAFSPDGKLLAACTSKDFNPLRIPGRPMQVTLWEVDSGAEYATFKLTGVVDALAFSTTASTWRCQRMTTTSTSGMWRRRKSSKRSPATARCGARLLRPTINS